MFNMIDFRNNNLRVIKRSLVLLAIFILFAIHLSLSAQIVARVGDFEITVQQLSQEIEYISRDDRYEQLSYLERRDIALENLIYENLIYHYALESRIEVTDQELEGYFIAQFGDLPRFSTDGFFDMQKYQTLKNTPEVRKIMNELRRELIIAKTETILKSNFHYNDQILLERYINENTNIDISFVVIKEEDANIPFFINPLDAYAYYHKNRRQYPDPEYYQVEFFIIPHDKYSSQVTVMENEIDEYFMEIESLQDNLRDEIREQIRFEKSKRLAYDEALRTRHNLINNLFADVEMLETKMYGSEFSNLNIESVFTRYELVQAIESINLNEYSPIIETDHGFLVFRVTGKETISDQFNYSIARNVWQDFVKKSVSHEYQEQYRQFYHTNLSDFIVPAAHITRLSINKNDLRNNLRTSDRLLRSFYENNLELFTLEERNLSFRELRDTIIEKLLQKELETLKDWCEVNIYLVGYDMLPSEKKILSSGVIITNEVVFLELIPNQEEISEQVKSYLIRDINTEVGSYETNQEMVYYRINSYFPAYIPSFEDVEDYLIKQLGIVSQDEQIDYQEYYVQHLNLFAAPDSLQLTGLYVPIVTDTLKIAEDEARQYYLAKMESFYSDPQTIVEYIYVLDPGAQHKDFVKQIIGWLDRQIPISLIQFCFGANLLFPQNEPFPTGELPSSIYQMLQGLAIGQREGPIYYDQGWLIIEKKGEIPARRKSYDTVREDLYDELLYNIADHIAYEKARQLFLDTNSIDDLTIVTDTLLIFTTEKRAVTDSFPPLADIIDYQQRLINLRRNEKLNTLYRDDNGYGVIFLKDKDVNQYYSYEESLPMISRLISDEQRATNAQNYITQLRELVIHDTEPDSLLIFFGGWHMATNLSINSTIPRIKYSYLIIDDAIKRNVGEVSHVIKISDNEYIFYRVDKKQRVDRDSFHHVRDHYREYIAELEFRKWLDQYRTRKVVEKY
ncbi:MAG: peptidylprolyl isomerase [Candidatus Cloacimonetes bacterium]|nr:peptidylprolyl isomerase [Candidatus Cloacimonadota bacterium]